MMHVRFATHFINDLSSKVLSPLAYRQMREYVEWWEELIESKKGSEHEDSQGTPLLGIVTLKGAL